MKTGLVCICMRDKIETAFIICGTHYQKISGTSGKNHFHEMNGDVGWQGGSKV